MTPSEIRQTVRTLAAQGKGLREISRLLALSRNTVRRILRAPETAAAAAPPCDEEALAKLKAAFARARGNVVRVQELLADDDVDVAYSTLTRWVREAGLRRPPRRPTDKPWAEGPRTSSPARRCSTTPRRIA